MKLIWLMLHFQEWYSEIENDYNVSVHLSPEAAALHLRSELDSMSGLELAHWQEFGKETCHTLEEIKDYCNDHIEGWDFFWGEVDADFIKISSMPAAGVGDVVRVKRDFRLNYGSDYICKEGTLLKVETVQLGTGRWIYDFQRDDSVSFINKEWFSDIYEVIDMPDFKLPKSVSLAPLINPILEEEFNDEE